MSLDLHGKTSITEENLLTKPLVELDFGPFTHPFSITWAGKWHSEMIKHLGDSIKTFRDRRILIVSWVLAALLGVFGNLFASSLFGKVDASGWGFAVVFLIAACAVGSLLFWYFPPTFQHVFQIWFGKTAFDARTEVFEKFGHLDNGDKLGDFLRVYHLLLVRDCLREHPTRLTKVTEVKATKYGYETWVTVQLRGRASWLGRSVEKQLWDELGLLCDVFATTILPIRSIDDQTPTGQIRAFDSALGSIRFDSLEAEICEQILGMR